MNKKDLLLYAVTDRTWLNGRTLYQQVEEALKGGVTFLQLREKDLDEETFMQEALEIKGLCEKYHVPFVINDNVELAEKIQADGVHVGQKDMEAGKVREVLGQEKIIGVSARTVEQAVAAAECGADYVSVGAVFGTGTKQDAVKVEKEMVKAIAEAVDIPVISIGGITEENVQELKGTGICGVAVVSSIFAKENIEESTAFLKKQVQKALLPEMKGIIFDVDGTLLDTMVIWTDSGARYLKSVGIEAEEGLGDRLFAMTADGGAAYLKENYNLPDEVQDIKKGIVSMVEKAYYEYADFKPGAKELLEELKKREIPMTIASSTDSHLIKAVMDRLGYTDYFQGIFSCSDYNTTKSEPKIFNEAIQVMGTEPENTWIFEDGLYSILTGNRAGFHTVGVYDVVSHKDQEEIMRNADIYVEDLTGFEII